MSRPGTVGALSGILVAGLAMWDAWVAYRDTPTRRNLGALVVRVIAFAAAVQSGAPALSQNARAVLQAAIDALTIDVSRLRIDFPGM